MTPWERYVVEIRAVAVAQKALERRRRDSMQLLAEEQGLCKHETTTRHSSRQFCVNCGKGEL